MEHILRDIVPIIALLSVFGVGLAVVYILASFARHRRELQSKEILAAIEKGIDVPFPKPREKNYRKSGFIWTSVGVALVIALGVAVKWTVAVWGLLPLAVGVAYLLIDLAENKVRKETA